MALQRRMHTFNANGLQPPVNELDTCRQWRIDVVVQDLSHRSDQHGRSAYLLHTQQQPMLRLQLNSCCEATRQSNYYADSS